MHPDKTNATLEDLWPGDVESEASDLADEVSQKKSDAADDPWR